MSCIRSDVIMGDLSWGTFFLSSSRITKLGVYHCFPLPRRARASGPYTELNSGIKGFITLFPSPRRAWIYQPHTVSNSGIEAQYHFSSPRVLVPCTCMDTNFVIWWGVSEDMRHVKKVKGMFEIWKLSRFYNVNFSIRSSKKMKNSKSLSLKSILKLIGGWFDIKLTWMEQEIQEIPLGFKKVVVLNEFDRVLMSISGQPIFFALHF